MTALSGSVPHVLACRSFVMGTCNLVIIGLPAGWPVRSGRFPPEVDHWRPFGEVNWAVAGRGSFRALIPREHAGPSGNRLLEGRVEIERAGTRAAAALLQPEGVLGRVSERGETQLGGHPARVARGAVARGLGPWRRWVPAAAVGLACPHTQRNLRILLETESEAALNEALAALTANLACH